MPFDGTWRTGLDAVAGVARRRGGSWRPRSSFCVTHVLPLASALPGLRGFFLRAILVCCAGKPVTQSQLLMGTLMEQPFDRMDRRRAPVSGLLAFGMSIGTALYWRLSFGRHHRSCSTCKAALGIVSAMTFNLDRRLVADSDPMFLFNGLYRGHTGLTAARH